MKLIDPRKMANKIIAFILVLGFLLPSPSFAFKELQTVNSSTVAAQLESDLLTAGGFGRAELRAASESVKAVDPVSTTDLSLQDELNILTRFLDQLRKEEQQAGSGKWAKVVVISDQHGTIDKFDALICDAIRSVLPEGKIPADFKLNPDQSLEEQLALHGVSLNDDFDGRLYFHNLGDFMDRGPDGVKVFRRSLELINAGLSDFIIGNHDLWEFMNLQAFHLPWYAGYNFYGNEDARRLVERMHSEQPQTRTKTWWAGRLAEFTAYQTRQQKEKWAELDIKINGQLDEKGKRVLGTGLYAQVSASLTPEQEKLWDQLRGWNLVDIYTGVRAVGTVSIRWWNDLLKNFEDEFNAHKNNLPGEGPALEAWVQAIAMMDQIISELSTDYVKHVRQGEWWWTVFEAINYQNYTSPEWWAKDWVFHKDWGTSVLDELNHDIPNPADRVTAANYLDHHTLQRVADFFRDHFTLYVRDIYQNVYMHAFLPVDPKTGEFFFVYRGKEYRGDGDANHPSIWEGLDRITHAVRNRENSMDDLYEDLQLVNSWYADNTTLAKPPQVAKAINVGVDKLAKANGFNRLVTGHVPFYEFSKLSAGERGIITGFQTGTRIIFSDHGMGTRFGSRGALIDISPDGLKLRGFEYDKTNGIVDHPRTVANIKGTDGVTEQVLFHNPGIPRNQFLPQIIQDVENRIAVLHKLQQWRVPSSRSELRTLFATKAELLQVLQGVIEFDQDNNVQQILNVPAFRDLASQLYYNYVYTSDPEIKKITRQIARQGAKLLGTEPASLANIYEAQSRDAANFTIPSNNIRLLLFDTARALISTAQEMNAGAFQIELARSERGYTGISYDELVTGSLFAAIAAGYSGPLHFKLDHSSVTTKDLPNLEGTIKLQEEAIQAGVFNIDIDASALEEPRFADGQPNMRANIDATVQAALHARTFGWVNAPQTIITLGGEAGGVGTSVNTTPEVMSRFLSAVELKLTQEIYKWMLDHPQEFQNVLQTRGTKEFDLRELYLNIASGQNVTAHGGLFDPKTGERLAKIDFDFDLMQSNAKAARQLGAAGYEQHGASTVPVSYYGQFVKNGVAEVHLATAFMETVMDFHLKHPDLFKALSAENQAAYLKTRDAFQAAYQASPSFKKAFEKHVKKVTETILKDTTGELARKFSTPESIQEEATKRALVDTERRQMMGAHKRSWDDLPLPVRNAIFIVLRTQFRQIFATLGIQNSMDLAKQPLPFPNLRARSELRQTTAVEPVQVEDTNIAALVKAGVRVSLDFTNNIATDVVRKIGLANGATEATTNPFSAATSVVQKNDPEFLDLIRQVPSNLQGRDAFKWAYWRRGAQIAEQFRGIFEETKGRKGFVSVEVDPTFAYLYEVKTDGKNVLPVTNAEGRVVIRKELQATLGETIESVIGLKAKLNASRDLQKETALALREAILKEAKQISALAPNIAVKIGNTRGLIPFLGDYALNIGYGSVVRAAREGISSNFTLVFAYEDSFWNLRAYSQGKTDRRLAKDVISAEVPVAGHNSFFVSRIDAYTDKNVGKVDLNYAQGLIGVLSVAEAYLRDFSDPNGNNSLLAQLGLTDQDLIVASLGNKLPGPADLYLRIFIGGGERVILTIPTETIQDFNKLPREQVEAYIKQAPLKKALKVYKEQPTYALERALISIAEFLLDAKQPGIQDRLNVLYDKGLMEALHLGKIDTAKAARHAVVEFFKFKQTHIFKRMLKTLSAEGDQKFAVPFLQAVDQVNQTRAELRLTNVAPVKDVQDDDARLVSLNPAGVSGIREVVSKIVAIFKQDQSVLAERVAGHFGATAPSGILFDSTLLLDKAAVAIAIAVRTIFSGAPIVVVADSDESLAILAEVNAALEKEGLQPFEAETKVGLAIRSLKKNGAKDLRAIVSSNSDIAQAIRKEIPNLQFITEQGLARMFAMHPMFADLALELQRWIAVAKSA